MALDVLHDHDGIVDHDADGEHQPEERERVDREAEGEQHREGADRGDRYRDERDERGAPGLQEEDDDQHYQRDRLQQCVQDRFDRLAHELGRIVQNPVVHPFGEVLLQLLHGLADGLGEIERICTR